MVTALALAGLTLLGAAIFNRWWGGMLTWPLPPIALTVLLLNSSESFWGTPAILVLPMVLAVRLPAALAGGILSTVALWKGRVPDSPHLTPEAREAAALGGVGCCVMGALLYLL
jgi:hypothetical protein